MDENLLSALRVAKFNPCIRYEVPQFRPSDFDTQLDQSRRLRSFALISLDPDEHVWIRQGIDNFLDHLPPIHQALEEY